MKNIIIISIASYLLLILLGAYIHHIPSPSAPLSSPLPRVELAPSIDWDIYEKNELARIFSLIDEGACLTNEDIVFLEGTALISEEEAQWIFEVDAKNCSEQLKGEMEREKNLFEA